MIVGQDTAKIHHEGTQRTRAQSPGPKLPCDTACDRSKSTPYLRLPSLMTFAVWKVQYRCGGWSNCQSAACPLVQACEPTTRIIAIDIPAVLDCADAIDNLSGLIKFKRYLGQAVEIAVWMRAHQERNLWFGEPDFSCRFHRACSITVRASPDHDISHRGGYVDPHRHLEDETDHLLFFCHFSSPVRL